MNIQTIVSRLEAEWDVDGFLGNLRQGSFAFEPAQRFLSFLKEIELDDEELIPKRLLSLLWYLPSFLEWQKERIEKQGGDAVAYARFVTEVQNTLEDVLGVP